MIRNLPTLLLLVLASLSPAFAHELWIEPEEFTLEQGENVKAHIFVGENFNGAPLSWLPNRFTRAEIVQGDGMIAVTSRLGDRPAVQATPDTPGLAVIVVETAPSKLTYREWQKFVTFVDHKDFPRALEEHQQRGLPEVGFTETYTRHVKSLVAVGDGQGADRAFGLATEIVALTNPYTDDLSAGVTVEVLYLGQPRPDAQLEVFEKSGATVEVFLLRTGPQGRVSVPVKPGHSYLLDAVVLRDTGSATTEEGPVWETLWAGLSFRTP